MCYFMSNGFSDSIDYGHFVVRFLQGGTDAFTERTHILLKHEVFEDIVKSSKTVHFHQLLHKRNASK
jgi:hypothetical protein